MSTTLFERRQARLATIVGGSAAPTMPSLTVHFAAAGRLWECVVGSTGARLVSVGARCLETGAVRQVLPSLDAKGRARFGFSPNGVGYGAVDLPPPPELRSTIRLFGEDWLVEEVAPDGRWPDLVTLACPSLVLGRVSWPLVGWLAQIARNLIGESAIERLYRSTVVVDGVKLGFRVLRTALVEAAEVVTVGDVVVKVRGGVPTETRYERAFWARVREGDALAPEVVARREARAHVLPDAADSAIVADPDLGYPGVYVRAPAPAVPPTFVPKRGWAEEPEGAVEEGGAMDAGTIRCRNRLRVHAAELEAPRAARDGFGRRRGPGWESYQRFLAGLLDAANDRPDPAVLPADLAAEVGCFDYQPALLLHVFEARARAGADASSRARRVESAPPPEVTVPTAAPSPDAWAGGLLGSGLVLPCQGFASARLGVGKHVIAPFALGPGRLGEIARLTFAAEWDRPCNVEGAHAVVRLCRGRQVIHRWAVPMGGGMVHEYNSALERILFKHDSPVHLEIVAEESIAERVRVAVQLDWIVRRTDGPRVSGGIAKASCLPGHEVAIQLPSLPAKITRVRFAGEPTQEKVECRRERALVMHRGVGRADRYVANAISGPDGSIAVTASIFASDETLIVCEGERLLLRVHPARDVHGELLASRTPVTVECAWEEA